MRVKLRRRLSSISVVLGIVVAAVLAAVAIAGTRSTSQVNAVAAADCGTKTGPPATYAHVLWIWMENHSYSDIIGSPDAPYMNSLAQVCGLATNYSAITHPSLPNYIAATSGSTQKIHNDTDPASHPLSAVSLFEQAGSAGSYEESMPSNCYLTDFGDYAVRHNPEAYYTRIRTACGVDNVPMGTTSSGAFLDALNAGTLPKFSFITPNLQNDMHNGTVAMGDAWLQSWVPKITASPSYQAGDTVLVITFDEGRRNIGQIVATIVVSPYTPPGTRSATAFNHYSLLRTTEELLGIPTYLGNAATATSMRSAFGL